MDVTPPESDTDRKEEKYEMEEAGEANGQIKISFRHRISRGKVEVSKKLGKLYILLHWKIAMENIYYSLALQIILLSRYLVDV